MFIHTSAFAAVALLLPWLQACRSDRSSLLARPDALSSILDQQTILEIGEAYCQSFPAERNQDWLQRQLLDQWNLENVSDTGRLKSYFLEQIENDFTQGQDRVVFIKGWVLSITEAQQCALFFLI